MDLISGMIAANAPIGQQDAVGSYATGVNAGQVAAKNKMENENALYQQNLTLRLQKTIQQSTKPNGDLDYDALARNGKANGISPQTIDYMTKQLPAQWKSLADTAQAKMQLQMQSPTGSQQALQDANTPSATTTAQPWTTQPAKLSQSSTQSSSKAAATPVDNTSTDTSDNGDTSKNYTYLTPDEKYTSKNPIKMVNGQVVNAGSNADLEAQAKGDTSGFITPDMLQSNQTTTGASAVNESGNQVSIGASTLNPNAVNSDTLSPDTSDETAPTDQAIQNASEQPAQEPSAINAPAPEATQAASTGGLYDIGNKMGTINPSQMMGQGAGSGKPNYFQINAGTTDEERNTVIRSLQRTANLPDISKLSRTDGDNLINQFLKTQQDKDYDVVIHSMPVLLPNAEGKYDYNEFGKRSAEWQKDYYKISADWAEKYGKEYADQLTQKINNDANNRANQQLQNDATKYNNDINGRNEYAQEISAVLGKSGVLSGKLNSATFGSIKEMQDFAERASAYNKLFDKIDPSNALSTLGWAKNFIQAEGLGEAEGTMKLVQLLAAKNPMVRAEIEATYGGNLASIGIQELGHILGKIDGGTLADLRNEMKFKDDWKTHTGKGELKPIGGTAPDTTNPGMNKPQDNGENPPSPPPASANIVKSGWYNSPTKATGDTFQTDNGSIYKVASRGPVSGLPKTVIDDNGSLYNVSDRNPADPTAKVDLIPQGGTSDSGSTPLPWTNKRRTPTPRPSTPKLDSNAPLGSQNNPIPYTKGMKTKKGLYYNVGGQILPGKN